MMKGKKARERDCIVHVYFFKILRAKYTHPFVCPLLDFFAPILVVVYFVYIILINVSFYLFKRLPLKIGGLKKNLFNFFFSTEPWSIIKFCAMNLVVENFLFFIAFYSD